MSVLRQVFLLVNDVEASRGFYEEVFGFTPSRVGSDSVSYDLDGCVLKLQGDFEEKELMDYGLEPPGESRGDGCVFVLEIDEELGVLHRRCLEKAEDMGGMVLTDVLDVEWCDAMFLVRDPDGYVLEIRD